MKANSHAYSDAVINRLWARMAQVYGHRWESAYGLPGDSAFQVWKAALAEQSAEMIGAAFKRCVKVALPWPPTLPEFLGYLRPSAEELGLPDFETAWRMAIAGDEKKHPLVYLVLDTIGRWDFRRMGREESRRVFRENYAAAVHGWDVENPYQIPEHARLSEPAPALAGPMATVIDTAIAGASPEIKTKVKLWAKKMKRMIACRGSAEAERIKERYTRPLHEWPDADEAEGAP